MVVVSQADGPAPTASVNSASQQRAAETIADVLALPVADYKAVVPGLMPFSSTVTEAVSVGTIRSSVPLYGADRKRAVARLDSTDFLGKPAVITVVDTRGAWSKILTPARVALPSQRGGDAPAQSAAWVQSKQIVDTHEVRSRVEVDLTNRTLATVAEDGSEQSFPVAIGTAQNPTPSAVSGYLEARYVDPKQGTGDEPIQLTSLHAATEDTPVAGGDGGVIAAHYNDVRSGAVSHGCLRLDHDAVAAINALPLGTVVTITP
ncbi:L,D-transpeptidase [Curtobacterium sp. 20TX0008]|uniref:L,D-transpeptidase n=1 Tax=Curtobacterium sp. 20TX0008 TaxID=3022018 RepID=UPI00232FA0D5|nr:L,D-transpeptidase [Curtobacterium sp. 20TX0008]MDB6425876.1 L,D-transpeptidase [Curtobacterium sp. 20TX0008]